MSHPTECPRCRGRMEEGFVLDRGHANALSEQEWMEGQPEKSFWTGIKTKGHQRMKVQSFRCEKCGLLESYAVVPVE